MKENNSRIAGAMGSVSGIASILGSWQVCHNVCLGLIALLSVIGISIVGMPLAFLTRIAVPMWSAAFALLLITLGFYFTKRCISGKLITFNSGLIIAGVPFQPLQAYSKIFWIIGGTFATVSVVLFIKDKIGERMRK